MIKQIFNIKRKENVTNPLDNINSLFFSLDEETIRIEIGADLIPFGENIGEIINNIRKELKDELGFILQPVRIVDNSSFQENEYSIIIENKTKYSGFVIPNREGIEDDIYENMKNVLLNNFQTIMTNELTERYIESVRAKNGLMIYDITGAISTTEIRIILSDLLEKGKSIKNISKIFEKISEQIYIENKHDYRNPHKVAEEIIKQL